jgi:Ca-activated chloride channel family protein
VRGNPRRPTLAAVAVAALGTLCSGGALQLRGQAETLPASQERGEARIRVTSSLTLVEATVRDRRGQALDGLTADDFRVYEDGAEQKITHFSRDEIPLAVAMVLDLSGSIEPFLGPLRYASMSSLRALKKDDQVALFTFTNVVQQRVGLTHDKRAVSDEFESLRAGGATNINDAVYQAARYLAQQAPAARRVILLVSDNKATDRGSVSPAEVTRAVLEADAAVYSVKVPGRNPLQLGLSFGAGLVDVEKLAQETGGEMFDVQKEGSMYVALKKVIDRLKTRYTLGYVPPTPGDGKFHRLEVRLAPGAAGRTGGHAIVSKRGYYGTRQATAAN